MTEKQTHDDEMPDEIFAHRTLRWYVNGMDSKYLRSYIRSDIVNKLEETNRALREENQRLKAAVRDFDNVVWPEDIRKAREKHAETTKEAGE